MEISNIMSIDTQYPKVCNDIIFTEEKEKTPIIPINMSDILQGIGVQTGANCDFTA